MRALRVAFVAPFGTRRKGTTRARVLPLARALALRGHHIRVVVPAWDGVEGIGRHQASPNLEIRELGHRGCWPTHLDPGLLARTWREVLSHQPDVLHCFKPVGYSGAAALLAIGAGFRRKQHPVVVVDSDDLEGRGGWAAHSGRSSAEDALLSAQERIVLRAATVVTVASRFLTRILPRWGIEEARIHYLPNATSVPADALASEIGANGGPTVLIYTRFNEFDIERAVGLLGELLERHRELEIVVIGDGEHRARFERLLYARAGGDRVHRHGFLDRQEVGATARGAALALWLFDPSPINRARCPVKLLELMAWGIPIVAEDVGEVRSLLGETGRIVRAGDGTGVLGAVEAVLASDEARQRLGRTARKRVEELHTWRARAASLESTYYQYT